MCFIDPRKAYDSVDHSTLWVVLQQCYRLPPKHDTIIRALHENSTATVHAYSKMSGEFVYNHKWSQGMHLHFDALMCMAFEEYQHQGKGVRVV